MVSVRWLVLTLALVNGTLMSVLHNDDFESGSLASYPHVLNAEVASDSTLGGTKAAITSPGGTVYEQGVLGIGKFIYIDPACPGGTDPENIAFSWGTTPLASSGRDFTLAECVDNSVEPWYNGPDVDNPYASLELGRNPPTCGSPYRVLLQLIRFSVDADTVGLALWDPGLNQYIGLDTLSGTQTITPIGTPNTPMTIRLTGRLATITGGTTSGGGAASNDGNVYVYINGALTFRALNYPLGYHITNQGPAIYWNTYANVPGPMEWAQTVPMGRLKNFYVSDDSSDPGTLCAAPSIRVDKVTVPAASSQSFDFTTVGLAPDSFSLSDGESALFSGLAAGDGYGIAETPVAGWSTSFSVSNGSSPDNIVVTAGDPVTITVTNTQDVEPETEGPEPCCGSTGPSGAPTSTGYNGTGTTSPTGTTPPVVTPRVIPPGGDEPSYSTCNSGGGRPPTAPDPVDYQSML